ACKRKWSPTEEDQFIHLWAHNLHLFNSGKKLVDIYETLSEYLLAEGIEITAKGVKTKMESLKRKYTNLFHAGRSDQSSIWKHYDTMSILIGDQGFSDQSSLINTLNINHLTVDKTYNSVFLDECCKEFFNDEECNRVNNTSAAKKRKKRFSKNTTPPLKPRRLWTLDQENIFLDVWQKYAVDILGERKNQDVYVDMQHELESFGLFLKPSDIKAKIESFKRKFRAQKDAAGDQVEWVHYRKVRSALNPLKNQISDVGESSSSDDDKSWLKEAQPQNTSMTSSDDIEQYSQSEESTTANSCDIPDLRHIRSDSKTMALDVQLGVKPYNKRSLVEEFSQYLTKELSVLNDDLLIEAKRKIYNVICLMQMKQNEMNKET
ncbi:hypothetical protein KR067_002638, partial [Drosophila pandora]